MSFFVKKTYPINQMKMKETEIKFNIEETKNLDECMNWVMGHMSSGPEGDNYLKEWLLKHEDEALMFHHGYGTFIRNTLELWHDGPAVQWFNEHGIYHADDMSSIIFVSLHRRENGNDINLDGQIKKYRDHWDKYDPNVNKGIRK